MDNVNTGKINPLISIGKSVYRFFKSPPAVEASLSRIPVNGVLRNKSDFRVSMRLLKEMGMPIHNDYPKNWDSVAALAVIRRYFPDLSSSILDAGGEYYSRILGQLEISGYKNLRCINIAFKHSSKGANIQFENGDITKTKFNDGFFDAITCLSVIEHGVSIDAYFKEMARIIKAGGILFTSTDYWHEPIATDNKFAYGHPIRVFTAQDVLMFMKIAESYGFEQIVPIELECSEKVVTWKEYKLDYTFIYFSLRKKKSS